VITLVVAALGISAESGNTPARLQRHDASRARGHARMDSRAWKPRDQAAGFLHDDPDGVREMLDAVARLVDDPRPDGSFPYGSPDRRRLRIGRYRVMYDITAETVSQPGPAFWARGCSGSGCI
jgi:mRNA interferase RelE/StbE